jgi:DNA-binding CsgD family transcriptional regulator
MPAPELVGRDVELSRLAALVDALGPGPADVLVVSGEAGIGKTALLDALGRRAAAAGHRVMRGTAVEFEAAIPFGVVEDALGAAAAPLREGAGLTVERHRSYRALAAGLGYLAGEGPLVVVLDDLHWADPASRELVSFLLRHRPDGPLLLALAMRPAPADPGLDAAVQRAVREGGCTEMHLGPLDRDSCALLLGTAVAPGRREALRALGGGNPFFLLQLARAADGDLPASVRSAVEEQLRGLAEAPLRMLRGAAVAGDPFPPALAAAAAGLADAQAAPALDALRSAGLVVDGDAPAPPRLRHPIVRRAVYEGAAPAWRVAAHARAAAWLARNGGDLRSRAHHLEQSATTGDLEAARILERAAARSRATAPAAAARWLEAARTLLPDEPGHASWRGALLLDAAAAHGEAGGLERSAELLAEAIADAPPEPAGARAALVTACAGLERLLGRHGAAEARLRGALPEADRLDPAASAALRVELVAGCVFQAERFDLERGRGWAEQARAEARRAGSPALESLTAAVMGLVECAAGATAAARACCDDAAAALDGLGDGDAGGAPAAAFYLGWAEYFVERFDDAARHLRHGAAAARATGQGHMIAPLLLAEAAPLLVLGRLPEVEAICESTIDAGRTSGNPQLLSWALSKRCLTRTHAGDLDGALRDGEEALAIAARGDSQTLAAGVGWSVGGALIEGGDPERGRELILTSAGGPGLGIIFPCVRPLAYELLTRAELQAGRRQAAAAWASRAEGCADLLGLDRRRGLALRARAAVALGGGDAPGALAWASEAARAASGVGARTEAARARTLAGRALAALGRRDEAIAELEAARAELAACGAERWRDEAARELRRLGRRVARAAPAGAGADMDGLSPRQREVADLVAEGRRNREIAERLHISERTVEDTLARVRAKLGVSSRAGIGAAVERGRHRTG